MNDLDTNPVWLPREEEPARVGPAPQLSIVTSLYRSAPYIEEFCRRCTASARRLNLTHEIVVVNDGSPDNSADIARDLIEQYATIRLVDLSRNFGHHKALLTGLRLARGELVFMLDVDLEEAPELVEEFYEAWKQHSGAVDVVFGIQKELQGSIGRKFGQLMFYRLFNLLCDTKIPLHTATVRLMTRRYVDAILSYTERTAVLAGLGTLAGFAQLPFPIHKSFKGTSTYSLWRRILAATQSIISFSARPAYLIAGLGAVIMAVSAITALTLIFQRLAFDSILPGWTSVMVLQLFLNGVMLVGLGVCCLYIALTFEEVKKRPLTVIKKIWDARSVCAQPETPERKAERV